MQGGLTELKGTALLFHEDHWTEEKFSADMELEFGEEFLYGKTDLMGLTSMAVHLGSMTTHVTLSKLRLRCGGHSLSSQSVVKSKEIAYESPVLATPYRDDGDDLDWDLVKTFLEQAYNAARLIPDLIDTGVVVVSGRAGRQRRDDLLRFMDLDERKFLVLQEAKNLQAVLAAWGAGAIKKSATEKMTVLNVDIGAEGIRFAWVDHGRIEGVAITSWGAEIVKFDASGKLLRVDEMTLALGAHLDVPLEAQKVVTPSQRQSLAAFLADVIVRYIQGERLSEGAALFFSEPPPVCGVESVQFSGGVAEYVYGYETQPRRDLGYELGAAIRRRAPKMALTMQIYTPPFRIRATPIGVSRQVMHLSGNMVFSSRAAFRTLDNLMVIAPRFRPQMREEEAQVEVERALNRVRSSEPQPLAFSTDFVFKESLDVVARALEVTARAEQKGEPLVLVGESRVSHEIARKVVTSVDVRTDVVALAGVHSHEMDILDISGGQNRSEVTVEVRSLVFR